MEERIVDTITPTPDIVIVCAEPGCSKQFNTPAKHRRHLTSVHEKEFVKKTVSERKISRIQANSIHFKLNREKIVARRVKVAAQSMTSDVTVVKAPRKARTWAYIVGISQE
jgi:hypothetical protein